MREHDGYESEMNDTTEPSGQGHEPLSTADQASLEQLAASFSRPEDADLASSIRASVFAAHLTTDNGDPAATPASNANGVST